MEPEEALGGWPTQQQAELFRLLVENVKDYAIFALNPDGYVMTWNAGAELVKGYREDEIVGHHFSCFYTEADRAAGTPARLLAVAEAEGRVEHEGWRVRKNGELFWADVILTALRDPLGALQGYAKVTRDLTERRRAEESLRTAYQELEQRVHDRTRQLEHANKALAEKVGELEQFFEATVERELKMIELEREVDRLRRKAVN